VTIRIFDVAPPEGTTVFDGDIWIAPTSGRISVWKAASRSWDYKGKIAQLESSGLAIWQSVIVAQNEAVVVGRLLERDLLTITSTIRFTACGVIDVGAASAGPARISIKVNSVSNGPVAIVLLDLATVPGATGLPFWVDGMVTIRGGRQALGSIKVVTIDAEVSPFAKAVNIASGSAAIGDTYDGLYVELTASSGAADSAIAFGNALMEIAYPWR
jgi:hypothetical protein